MILSIEIARKYYSHTDPVHGFEHVLRVFQLAKKIALAEGADIEIVSVAALLHDAQNKNPSNEMDTDNRITHHLQSAKIAREILSEIGWQEERIEAVEHCILAHRFRDDTQRPQSLEAKVLFDADKIDAIGAVGVARAIAYASMAGQPFFAQPSDQFLKYGRLQKDEPHSAYHEYLFKLIKIKDRMYTLTGRSIAEKRHIVMKEYFECLFKECVIALE
jgi:uncharacterized protein